MCERKSHIVPVSPGPSVRVIVAAIRKVQNGE